MCLLSSVFRARDSVEFDIYCPLLNTDRLYRLTEKNIQKDPQERVEMQKTRSFT